MSYLAMSAAPIDTLNTQNNETPINKKKQHYNKTQKFRDHTNNFNPQKVTSVLQSIHSNTDDDNELGNYNPKGDSVQAKHSDNFKPLNPYDFPEKPVSGKEAMSNIDDVPQPSDNDTLNLQELSNTFMNDAQVRDYYRKLVPNYHNVNQSQYNKQYYNNNNNNNYSNSLVDTSQVLTDKLNYIIGLLEDQQDQRIGSVTEEVVLYSFLGVFIIFIVDSFTKVGKYVR